MHCTPKQFKKVFALCARVISFLTDNISDFATPAPTVLDLSTENDKLAALIGQAKGNHVKKDERDAQCLLIYNLLLDEIIYVDGIALGNKVLIEKSGFDASKEPEPHNIPAAPVIKKVKDGSTPHSSKINIQNMGIGLTYKVQTSSKADDEASFVTALETTNSKKLVLENLQKGVEIFIRIAASNRRGQGDWSELAAFIPQ